MKAIIVLLIMIVGLGAGAIYFLSQKDSFVNTVPSAVEEVSKTDSQPASYGNYLEYTLPVFETAEDRKKVLFFYASWCPTCKPTDLEFKSGTKKIPSDLTIFRVNYSDSDTDEDEKALAKKYGITYQHTFVYLDENDEEIKRWNGGSLDKLLSEIQ